MTRVALTLWDLLIPPKKPVRPRSRPRPRPATKSPPSGQGRKAPARAGDSDAGRAKPTMQQRYDALVVEMKQTYGLRIRKWRSSSTGCAWEVHYADGTVSRLIESPYPRGPVSCAIFLHEVGHHVLGLRSFSPRCLEEYHAWAWSLQTMRERKLNVTTTVEKRMAESLSYALAKARRRGLKRIPDQLMPYL